MPLLKSHVYPSALPRSLAYQVKVDGVALDVLHHQAAHHTSAECTGRVQVEIEVADVPKNLVIHPLSLEISAQVTGCTITFSVLAPQNIQIELEGQPLLYIYALAPAEAAPTGPHVRCYEAGLIHEVGMITLGEGEVCWIEPGAVVRGSIRSYNASRVRIGGYGILDGSYWTEHEGKRRRGVILDHCANSQVDTILMLGPCHWMISLGGCNNISVTGIRQIADDVSSDGIDICGSTRIRVKDCCLHNGDDNIAIKAIGNSSGKEELGALGLKYEDWKGTVDDVVVSECIFYNLRGGSAMEIGYETTTDHIRNIRFENIDVLGVHEFGSVFGIHNGDRACVENVVWDDIRVDHHYDKLVDIRVVTSRWNVDKERGRIRNITLRNIKAIQSSSNEGYTLSVICGYDAEHPVTGVTFGRFELGGKLIHNADELYLATKHAHGIRFLAGEVEADLRTSLADGALIPA